MKKLIVGKMLVIANIVACSSIPATHDAVAPFNDDPPIGAILRKFAVQRSLQECKTGSLSDEQCKKSIDEAQAHLDKVSARLKGLSADPRTNMCDLSRFAGSCGNPIYTLGDLADCLQVSADRGEALNSKRFVFNLDSHGCPTDAK